MCRIIVQLYPNSWQYKVSRWSGQCPILYKGLILNKVAWNVKTSTYLTKSPHYAHSKLQGKLEDFQDENHHYTGQRMDIWVHHRRTIGSPHQWRSRWDPCATIVATGMLRRNHHSVRQNTLEVKNVPQIPSGTRGAAQKHRSAQFRGGRIRIKGSPWFTKKKVAMSFITDGDKRTNPMISKKQVARGIENSTKS